jgi:tRNA-modifying protein YgfZ
MQTWFDLPRLTGIRISGADAIAFCQSQFTADFRGLATGRWQPCAWCNPKGRCITIILASIDENHVDLIAPGAQTDILKKLQMYAIGRKVSFSEPGMVSGHLDPGEAPGCSRLPDGRGLRLDEHAADSVSDQLTEWRIADLCMPLPWLNEHSSGQFLPQFLGLEDTGGLSYQKGCFPGQEIIARLHYLGKVKYRLSGFVLHQVGELPELATGQLGLAEYEQSAQILESLRVGDELIGLAVFPTELSTGAKLELSGPNGPLSGQMTEPKRLCYYRKTNND